MYINQEQQNAIAIKNTIKDSKILFKMGFKMYKKGEPRPIKNSVMQEGWDAGKLLEELKRKHLAKALLNSYSVNSKYNDK